MFFVFVFVFFSIFDCIFFMFSCSLLKWTVIQSILFPNLGSIFVTKALNSSVNCLFVSLCFFFFFPGVFFFSLESSSSAFSFYLTSSVSMNVGETVTYCSLKGVFLCGSIHMQTLCPGSLERELDLMWMQVRSFLRMCWQLSLGRGCAWWWGS